MARTATIDRKTAETEIQLTLNLDGTGQADIATGVGFFDHMLTLFAKHAAIDLTVTAKGDLHVDQHHTVEDVGICLGQALKQALGDKAGIRRYGHFTLPMEETLATVAIDLSGRYRLVFKRRFPVRQDRRFRQRAGRRILASLRRQRAVQLAHPRALRPQQPPHQRSDLQSHGPRAANGHRIRSAHDRRAEHQRHARRLSRLRSTIGELASPVRRNLPPRQLFLVDIHLEEPRQLVEVAIGSMYRTTVTSVLGSTSSSNGT